MPILFRILNLSLAPPSESPGAMKPNTKVAASNIHCKAALKPNTKVGASNIDILYGGSELLNGL